MNIGRIYQISLDTEGRQATITKLVMDQETIWGHLATHSAMIGSNQNATEQTIARKAETATISKRWLLNFACMIFPFCPRELRRYLPRI